MRRSASYDAVIVFVFVFLTLSLVISTDTHANQPVDLYGRLEIEVPNNNGYSNPFDFDEITLEAMFVSPNQDRHIPFDGFYDGDGNGGQQGNIWKIRFMPDEVGRWLVVWTWSDGTPGDGFYFDVVPSTNPGFLRVDPDRPYYVMHDGGDHFYWNGDTEWTFLSDEHTQQERFSAIAHLDEYRVNNLLMIMVNEDNTEIYPWLGPRSAIDRTRFDLSKMHDWEEVVEECDARGIIADLWFYSDDSVNLIPPAGGSYEDLLFRYLITRFAGFQNVTWNLALEFQEYRSSSWVEQRAAFVREHDPWQRLLAVHQVPGYYAFHGNEDLDHTSLQIWDTADVLHDVVLAERAEAEESGRKLPIFIEEFFIEGLDNHMGDFERFRQGIWTIALAGGGLKAASMGWLAGTEYPEAEHFELARIHQEFMERIPFWTMDPSDELVTNGYAMADPGEEYVVYLPHGGDVSVNVQGAVELLDVEWVATDTGEIIYKPPVNAQGWTLFSAPDSRGWVLYLHENPVASTTDGAPNMRSNIALHPCTPNPTRTETKISFFIPRPGLVDLDIYDVRGRKVAGIYQNRPLSAGPHLVEFNAARLGPGSYFYRLDAGGESIGRKFFIVR